MIFLPIEGLSTYMKMKDFFPFTASIKRGNFNLVSVIYFNRKKSVSGSILLVSILMR